MAPVTARLDHAYLAIKLALFSCRAVPGFRYFDMGSQEKQQQLVGSTCRATNRLLPRLVCS